MNSECDNDFYTASAATLPGFAGYPKCKAGKKNWLGNSSNNMNTMQHNLVIITPHYQQMSTIPSTTGYFCSCN